MHRFLRTSLTIAVAGFAGVGLSASAQQNGGTSQHEHFGDHSAGFFGDPAYGEFGVPPAAEQPLSPPITVRPLKPFDLRYLEQMPADAKDDSLRR